MACLVSNAMPTTRTSASPSVMHSQTMWFVVIQTHTHTKRARIRTHKRRLRSIENYRDSRLDERMNSLCRTMLCVCCSLQFTISFATAVVCVISIVLECDSRIRGLLFSFTRVRWLISAADFRYIVLCFRQFVIMPLDMQTTFGYY